MPVQGKGDQRGIGPGQPVLELPGPAEHLFDALVQHAALYPVPVEVVRDAQQAERHVVDPHELPQRLVVIIELGGVNYETIQVVHCCFHICVFTRRGIIIPEYYNIKKAPAFSPVRPNPAAGGGAPRNVL